MVVQFHCRMLKYFTPYRIIAFHTIFFVFHAKGYSKDLVDSEVTEPKEVLFGDLIPEKTLTGGLRHSFEQRTENVILGELSDGNTFLGIPLLNNSNGVPNQNTESSNTQKNYVQNITKDEISDGKLPSMDIFAFSPVFAPTSSKVQTEDCRRHSRIFLHQLKKYKLWALQMYDSSAKLPSGILRGNTNQLGDFDQCLSVTGSEPSTPTEMIRGQYCLASIDISATPHAASGKESLETPVYLAKSMELIKSSRQDSGHILPQFSTIKWGLCVPHSCTPNDVDASLTNALRHFGTSLTGLQIETQVDSDMCYDDQSTELSVGTVIAISMFCAVIAVALIATLRDDGTAVQLKSRGKLEKTLMAFSIKKTLSELLRVEPGDGDIQCINGIRSLCTVFLYVGHKVLSMALMPYSNRINFTQLAQYPVFMLISAFAIYVYAFILLSGVLTAYNMSREMKRKCYIAWKRRYLARFIR
uniref:Nose resistant-to-fluoxetine protein N-terminal domain-containing protein n=1 Tax=Timema tahoe TaxID=61484 RepID=A0A7R9IJY2_9NEOP|nr:unnamed protein product [Timema tahoe]